MARAVRWAQVAVDELQAIHDYVADDSTDRAADLIAGIVLKAGDLAEFAESGHIVEEIGDPSIRETPCNSYRIVYRVTATDVSILSILHGARDFESYWDRKR